MLSIRGGLTWYHLIKWHLEQQFITISSSFRTDASNTRGAIQHHLAFDNNPCAKVRRAVSNPTGDHEQTRSNNTPPTTPLYENSLMLSAKPGVPNNPLQQPPLTIARAATNNPLCTCSLSQILPMVRNYFAKCCKSVSPIIPTSFWWWVALWKLTMAIVCDKAADFNGYHWSGLVSRCTGQYVGLHLRLHAIMPMGWRGSTLKGCSLSNFVWSGSTPGQHLFVVLSKAVGECMHGFWFNKFCHCLVCELDVYEGMVSFSERELSLSACALFPEIILQPWAELTHVGRRLSPRELWAFAFRCVMMETVCEHAFATQSSHCSGMAEGWVRLSVRNCKSFTF